MFFECPDPVSNASRYEYFRSTTVIPGFPGQSDVVETVSANQSADSVLGSRSGAAVTAGRSVDVWGGGYGGFVTLEREVLA